MRLEVKAGLSGSLGLGQSINLGSSTFAKTPLNERGHSAYNLYHHFANRRAQLSRLS